jgi:hypothetical protein
MTGTGLLVMLNVTVAEVSSGTPSFRTAIWAVPVLSMSEARIWAVTRVLLTKVVARADPFHSTVVPRRPPKSLPFTIRVKAGPLTMAELGSRLEITGVAA